MSCYVAVPSVPSEHFSRLRAYAAKRQSQNLFKIPYAANNLPKIPYTANIRTPPPTPRGGSVRGINKKIYLRIKNKYLKIKYKNTKYQLNTYIFITKTTPKIVTWRRKSPNQCNFSHRLWLFKSGVL